jgi:5'-nucleotidase
MKILLSNDDGYRAPGLKALIRAVGDIAGLVVMAPSADRSCASSSLTLRQSIAVHRVEESDHEFYHVEGTPADCVHLAINGVLEEKPDMVVSGINAGSNLGDDVIYSGTVAAAIEGRFLGLPALAVSLASNTPTHYDTAARVVRDMISILVDHPLPGDIILNINVPDLPYDQLAGIYATRCGARHQSQPVVADGGQGDTRYFSIGPAGGRADAGPGTDFHAVAAGRVSVTPLHIDMTRHNHMTEVAQWVAGVHLQ